MPDFYKTDKNAIKAPKTDIYGTFLRNEDDFLIYLPKKETMKREEKTI